MYLWFLNKGFEHNKYKALNSYKVNKGNSLRQLRSSKYAKCFLVFQNIIINLVNNLVGIFFFFTNLTLQRKQEPCTIFLKTIVDFLTT